MDQGEQQGPWENLGRMDRTERLVNPVFREYADCLAQWELLETRVPWVTRVQKVLLEFLDLLVSEEIQEKMELREFGARRVNQAQQENED